MSNHDKVFGASGTSLENLPSGALRRLGGEQNVESALNIARALMPSQEPIDPALLSFLYFSQLASEASKPGATALGAASSALTTPAAYLMKDAERRRKAEDKLPATALQIAKLIKPVGGEKFVKGEPVKNEDDSLKIDQQTGSVIYNYRVEDNDGNLLRKTIMPDLTTKQKPVNLFNPEGESKLVIPGTKNFADAKETGFTLTRKPSRASIKSTSAGPIAKFMSREDAIKLAETQGLPAGPARDDFLNQITAKDESQIGKPVIVAGTLQEIRPLTKGDQTLAIQIVPSSAPPPYFSNYVNKRLPVLAKTADTYNTTSREVIPRVNEALNLLLTGKVKTGRLQQAMLPFKQTFNQAFGVKDAGVLGLESLQATSNYLAPKMRPTGSGSTSDMEFRAYQQAALYIGNTPEANYISLYAFKKMAENGVRLNRKERELLTSGNFTNETEINKELDKFDRGIFEKYTGDPNNTEEIQKFYDSRPNGAVIINNGIFDSKSPYVIKGWGG